VHLAQQAAELVKAHLTGPVAKELWVQHVEYDPEIPRWYLRFGCEGRDASTIYFDLGQRSLRYELYFMPDPPASHEELYRWLLRRNHHGLYGARFSLGPDGDVYVVGRVLYEHLTEEELDRVIGVCYELVETWFQTAIQIGFGTGKPPPKSLAPQREAD
jgi:hypothetical protein